VIFNYDGFLFGKAKGGLWVFDIIEKEWIFVPYYHPCMYGATNGGIYFDARHNGIYSGYYDGASYRLNRLVQNYRGDAPDQSVMIFPLSLRKERQINWIEVDWAQNSLDEYVYDAQTVDITVSVGDDKRLFWAYGQANAVSDTGNTIKIDNSVDTYNKVAVGDEILMLNRNNKGERAFIQSISGAGTNACVLTLDRSLTNKTENASYFNILPLRKADGTNTYTKVETAKFVPTFLGTKAIIELWVKQSNFPIQIEEIRVFISD